MLPPHFAQQSPMYAEADAGKSNADASAIERNSFFIILPRIFDIAG